MQLAIAMCFDQLSERGPMCVRCSFLHISIVSTSVALHISTGWAPLPKLSRSLVRRVAGLSDMFNGVGV